MRDFVFGLTVALLAASVFAADEQAAANVARKYSEAIACNIQSIHDQKNQYKSIKVLQGDKVLGGLGDLFVVYWEGDVGCDGGTGTVFPNFTVVEQNGFLSVPPVVVLDYKFPELKLQRLSSITFKNGQLQITGIAYGPDDEQGQPAMKVAYRLKLDQNTRTFVRLRN